MYSILGSRTFLDFHFLIDKFYKYQHFTNFSSSKGRGSHFLKIYNVGQSSLCFCTFSLALFECPHLHNWHWKNRFLYFAAFPFFLRRIPNHENINDVQPFIQSIQDNASFFPIDNDEKRSPPPKSTQKRNYISRY